MMRNSIIALPLIALVACGGQSTVPEDHYYRLPSPEVASKGAALTDGTIFVEQFIADGIHHERALVYADAAAPSELLQYHYHFWTDSPSRLLRDHFVDYLRSANAGRMITDSPEVPAELSIYGKIKRLDQIVNSSTAEVVAEVEFRVQKAGSDAPVLVRQYERTVAVQDRSMEAAVGAFGSALSGIYAQLVDDIAASH